MPSPPSFIELLLFTISWQNWNEGTSTTKFASIGQYRPTAPQKKCEIGHTILAEPASNGFSIWSPKTCGGFRRNLIAMQWQANWLPRVLEVKKLLRQGLNYINDFSRVSLLDACYSRIAGVDAKTLDGRFEMQN